MGIHIQEFGQNTFIVDAVPEIFGKTDIPMLITSLLEALHENGDKDSFKKEKEKSIALAATRAAISHDKRHSLEEAQTLVNQLFHCQHPYQCPQGKPTLVHLSLEELAKQFAKC
jgi:DNA mismatch repair protein MutL